MRVAQEKRRAVSESRSGENYCFLGAHLRILSDSPSLLHFLRNLYPRFLTSSSIHGVELQAWTKTGVPSCPLAMVSGTKRHFVLQTDQGYALHSENSEPQGVPRDAAEVLRFDRETSEPSPEAKWLPLDDSQLFSFVQLILLRTIAQMLPGYHLLHGAAAAWNGSGLTLVGSSGRGKTTLSLALAKRGFSFLSDDIACIDLTQHRLVPFPRSLNLRQTSLPLLASLLGRERLETLRLQGPIDIDRVLPNQLGQACPLHHVFLLKGFASQPQIRPIATRQALWEGLKASHGAVRKPGRSLLRLAPVFQQARCYELLSGTPEATALALQQQLAEPTP